MSLLTIPDELLLEIFECADATHRPSVLALALANRKLHHIAVEVLHRSVVLGQDPAHKQIERYRSLLVFSGSLSLVKMLHVGGYLDPAALVSLRRLLPDLTGLKNLVFGGVGATPEDLLDPQEVLSLFPLIPIACRLHVTRDATRSLPDSDIAGLIRVPQLYRIEFDLFPSSSVSVVAPLINSNRNIREVEINFSPHDWFDHHTRVSPSSARSGPHGLRVLFLDCRSYDIQRQDMEYWKDNMLLLNLKSLRIYGSLAENTFDGITADGVFRKLEAFIMVRPDHHTLWWSESRVQSHAIERFVLKLPCLTELRLCHWPIHKIGANLLQHHGTTLRRLDIFGDLSSRISWHSLIESIKCHCPLIEELGLTVPRSRGDRRERLMYDLLGSLPRLRHLHLELKPSSLHLALGHGNIAALPSDPTYDSYDRQLFCDALGRVFPLRNGHIRDILIDFAIDRTLASDIFQAISAGKGPGSRPLERLKLEPMKEDKFLPDDVSGVLSYLKGSWTMMQHPKDGRREILHTPQISEDLWQLFLPNEHWRMPATCERIYRRIWPASPDRQPELWSEDWHSYPLASLNPSEAPLSAFGRSPWYLEDVGY